MADDSWLSRLKRSGYAGEGAQASQVADDRKTTNPATATMDYSKYQASDKSDAIKRKLQQKQEEQAGGDN